MTHFFLKFICTKRTYFIPPYTVNTVSAGKFHSLLPLLLCRPELCVGGKTKHTHNHTSPTPLPHLISAFVQLISWPLVTWLIDCYQQVEVRDPICSRHPLFTSLRNYPCQNQFINPFTHRVGWAGQNSLNSGNLRIPARMPRISFYRLFCMSSLHAG